MLLDYVYDSSKPRIKGLGYLINIEGLEFGSRYTF